MAMTDEELMEVYLPDLPARSRKSAAELDSVTVAFHVHRADLLRCSDASVAAARAAYFAILRAYDGPAADDDAWEGMSAEQKDAWGAREAQRYEAELRASLDLLRAVQRFRGVPLTVEQRFNGVRLATDT
jgi:hypothetical protein